MSLSEGGLIRGGAYTWTPFCVSEKVGLSEGGLSAGGLCAELYGINSYIFSIKNA